MCLIQGSRLDRVIRGFMVQGGTISTGATGESIYGMKFEDENFELKHTRKGILSMVNCGPNTNGSQFSIVTTQAPQLDGKSVVFGKLVKGFGVLRAVEYVAVADDYSPTADVVIVECGEIPEGEDDGTINFFKDSDMYPDWPMDLDVKPDSLSWLISAVESIKVIGNEYYKVNSFTLPQISLVMCFLKLYFSGSSCFTSYIPLFTTIFMLTFCKVQKHCFKMAMRKYRKAIKYQDLCWEMPDLDLGYFISTIDTNLRIYCGQIWM